MEGLRCSNQDQPDTDQSSVPETYPKSLNDHRLTSPNSKRLSSMIHLRLYLCLFRLLNHRELLLSSVQICMASFDHIRTFLPDHVNIILNSAIGDKRKD
jgi:hypothetical protein